MYQDLQCAVPSMYLVRRCYMSIALYVCCEWKCVYTLMCNMTILSIDSLH